MRACDGPQPLPDPAAGHDIVDRPGTSGEDDAHGSATRALPNWAAPAPPDRATRPRQHTHIPDPPALSIDQCRTGDAIAQAHTATAPADRMGRRRAATDVRAVPDAQGTAHERTAPHAEARGPQAIDAHPALAGKPAQSVPVPQAANAHNPYAETLHQQTTQAHTTPGDIAGTHTRRQALTHRPTEIDIPTSDHAITTAEHPLLQRRDRRCPAARCEVRP
jgi:hypothetical protein